MKISIITIASALALTATSAAAQDFTSAPSERVAYSDLDLGSSTGRSALQQRIKAAASRVCAMGSAKHTLKESLSGHVCYKTSVAEGLNQVDRLIASRKSGAAMAAAITVVGIR